MVDVKIPELGESVTEGLLNRWLKKVGDQVEQYEPLVEVTTDKVNIEIPAEQAGVLAEILVQEGEKIGLDTVICRLRTDEDK
ncbi:biotin attachment protein [Alicyclobacillus tolerans]|uniref:biotin/lipoyl-containing protein n=1 Tax=Alicyclobacillus tolerans TaxID=90970 RepID=UPI001F2CEE59|nr:biotin/lipoyl-containing protein [Alicyclobacillus tolerans]MCF8564935.1 biotin attachment protein [Alicyclobacillus tolerans]